MIYISGGPMVNFDKAEEYIAFWRAQGQPKELLLNPASSDSVTPECRGFLWQGFLVRYSKPI